MKAVGIIAEYNPFHNGHAYQLQKAKELSHADYVIVVMSGNFVQRGTPALLDKFSRTIMALAGGADFVFELPTVFATASAEYFAAAGTALLNALGCVDTVCFGAETPNLPLMSTVAKILAEEPEIYTKTLTGCLKSGMSFPAARERAVTFSMAQDASLQQATLDWDKELAKLLQSPNNILALEYMKALIRQGSSVKPLPLQRRGSGYHALDLKQEYCSASALRSLLLCPPSNSHLEETLFEYVPKDTARLLLAKDACFLTEQDFSQMLYYKLLSERETGFSAYADSSLELSNKILHALGNFTDYTGFCEKLKSKDITYTRIGRLLLHILLNIKTSDYALGKDCGYVPYLRLLGFRKEAAPLFREIKKNASLPLLTNPAKDSRLLSQKASILFRQDIFASDLYYGVLAQKSHITQKNEYQRGLVVYPRM